MNPRLVFIWTEEEDARLRRCYSVLKSSELRAAFPQVKVATIHNRARKIGLPSRRGRPDLLDKPKSSPTGKMQYWTAEEDSLLKECYGKIPRGELSKRFIGRTAISLTSRARKLGLSSPLKEAQKLTVQELNAKQKENHRRWYHKTCDYRMSMINDARRRATKKGIPFDITKEDIVVPEFCPILGLRLGSELGYPADCSPSLDRKDPKKGYTRDNIWVICFRANRIKNDATLDELRKLVLALEKIP